MRPKIILKKNNHIEIVNDNLDYYLKSKKQIEEALAKPARALLTLSAVGILERVKIGRGRPAPNIKYEDRELITYYIRNEIAFHSKRAECQMKLL